MMHRMRLGVSFDGADPPEALIAIAELADSAGADSFWVASHLFYREPLVCATAALSATQSIGVVLMAMSPYTVHPIHATMAAATLDELFPGRAQLCFGVGAPRDLEAAGIVAEHPLGVLRETLEMSRSLLAGQTVEFHGQHFHAAGRRLAMGARPVPLWLAASGPRMLELAGELADGVVISAGTSPAFIRWCLDHVRRGEERSGRSIKKAALVFCSVDQDSRVANNRLRRRLAYLLRGQHHARNIELAETTLDQTTLADAFGWEDWERVEGLITDDVLRRHCASGNLREVQTALAAYRKAGLDQIVIYGVQEREHVQRVLAAVRS